MRVLIQRVKSAQVVVEGQVTAGIEKGLLLFVGIGKDDTDEDLDYLCRKVSNMRIFEDDDDRMNLDIRQVKGRILSVSQFTLYANTKKGNRPGFAQSAGPEEAKECWKQFNELLREKGLKVEEGVFGAHMEVILINDGPVTIWLDSANR